MSVARRRRRTITGYLLSGAALAAAVTVALFYGGIPWPLAYLAGINSSTFAFYGYDKLASRRGLSRVPEFSLHLLALAGGTPAAYLAQRTFRHKTVKGSFRAVFFLVAALQAAIIVWAVWYFRNK